MENEYPRWVYSKQFAKGLIIDTEDAFKALKGTFHNHPSLSAESVVKSDPVEPQKKGKAQSPAPSAPIPVPDSPQADPVVPDPVAQVAAPVAESAKATK